MTRELFTQGWQFALMPIGTEPKPEDFHPVDIPHDWQVWNTKNLYGDGDGCYKKTFTATDVAGKFYTLRFEGVYMDTTVFLNGEQVCEWKYGYTTFDCPLTGIKEGENEVYVRVRHKSPNTRWYSGSGIFRPVYLTIKGENEILPDGTYCTPKLVDGEWTLEIDTEVKGKGEAVLNHMLVDADNNAVALNSEEITLTEEMSVVSVTLNVGEAHLWDIDDPYCYKLITTLIVNDGAADQRVESIGFKTAEWTSDDGFYLNGRKVKINGVCMHHDLGALGSAVNKEATLRQLRSLKEMGVNSIRTSHNPPSVELMEAADELGVMINSEAFDMWEFKKTDYDYARFFGEWYERDVASWVRRDRNHPSMIMWSIGNEIYDTHAGPRGVEVSTFLRDNVFKHDYKRMYPVTTGSNYMAWENAQKCAEVLGAVGYNYAERLYDEHHAKHPEWKIYGSETASTIQSRGTYHFPASKMTSTHDDHQCSALCNCATGWGAIDCEYNITMDRNRPYSAGQYIWTGWDYIGEPTPYWTKNSYFGHSDTAGFPKDSYYAYRAEWAGKTVAPFVHLFPYWDFNEGQLVDIMTFSNCHETELIVNGESLGRYTHNHVDGDRFAGRWQTVYHKGYIKAIGYDEEGNKVCEMTRVTPEDAAKIILKPNKTELSANGEDMIFVEISTEDANGNPVDNDRSRVDIKVSGAGRLVGTDNGDSTDYDQYKGNCRKLFNGKLLAMIAATFESGDITLTVSSKGLPDATVTLKALPCENVRPVSCVTSNYEVENDGKVPVRKIEMSLSHTKLTPENPVAVATVKLLPAITTYSFADIGFKAITDAGVVTNCVEIEVVDGEAHIKPLGDGEYRLRAYCKNDTPYEEIISEIEMSNEGFGLASFNPYDEMISASLYSRANGDLQSVFEGGILTKKNWEETHVIFDSVDFGKYGSKEIKMWLYHNSNDHFTFDVYDGDEGFITTFEYDRPGRWNHYTPQSFILPEVLTGVHTLKFVFKRTIHFKGFLFKAPTKVDLAIPVADRDNIYGDTFTVCDDSVKHIGNNVTLEFNGFDFGEEGITGIDIKGLTHNDNDTIHVRFATAEGQDNQIVEFAHEDGVVTKHFDLTKVCGKCDVKLVFLPGCDFDLYEIKFTR